MREATFLKKNVERWEAFEKMLQNTKTVEVDALAEGYISITDDLSFAQTNYKDSKTQAYLNQLAVKAHKELYGRKEASGNKLVKFFSKDVPIAAFARRVELRTAAITFLLAIVVGMISTSGDSSFTRLILGDAYVNMTLENIEEGSPMAVYDSREEFGMFVGLAFNNIRVAFFAFVLGAFVSLGSYIVLLYNGIMVGTFMYFFIERDLLWESVRTIFIHGSLELSAIVIAGAAGLVIGNSILNPGTYSRLEAFRKASFDALRLVISLVPVFTVAAFLEGFVTRHTEMPDVLAIVIIVLSFTFIIWYYVLLPYKLDRKSAKES